MTAPDGTVTELRRQSAGVLRLLAAHAGRTVTKSDILDTVWGDIAVTEDSLVQCIADIRRALGSARDRLRTTYRSGYRLETDARPAAPRARALLRLAGALAVALLALGAWQLRDRPARSSGFQGPVVAVMPFENLAGGERWDRLARALTEDVIADLAQNSWLFVLADATTRDHADASPQSLRDDLGIGHVVRGSVQVDGDRLQVAATLADAATGRQTWSKRWEGPVTDLFAMQAAATEAVAAELAASWSGPIARAERATARGRGATDLAAYELALLGHERVHRFTREDTDAAIALLNQAVERDPSFGDAWAYLSFSYLLRIMPETPPDEQRRLKALATAAALEAYRVSPDLPKPIIQAAGVVARTDKAEAERMYRRAAAIAANNADMLAYVACMSLRVPAIAADAEGWVRRAVALNPAHPAWYNSCLGAPLFALGRYAEAAEAYEHAIEFIDERAIRSASLALAGDVAAAHTAMQETLAGEPGFSVHWFLDLLEWDPVQKAALARGLRLAGAPEGAS